MLTKFLSKKHSKKPFMLTKFLSVFPDANFSNFDSKK